VGVAALSGPVAPEKLEHGLAALRRMGFEPVLADNVLSRHGLFAGSDAERLAGFHRLAADPDLAAILFARGGHGVLRVLPGIDWELLARRPRAYVGYSDLTPFLLAVVRRLGLVAFHGPMVAADLFRGLDEIEEASLLGALAGRYPASVPCAGWLRAPAPSRDGKEGEVRGILLGGCLSLLEATLGTPWAPDLEGALVFWEDVGESPYRVDRMLTHLGLSGTLADIAGMVVGHPEGAAVAADPDRDPVDWAAQLTDSLAAFSWPLAWGLESGHRAPNRTLPLGLTARLQGNVARGAGGGRLVLGADSINGIK
jgi:muramoyltetrapeptide carboxypeptidase